MSQPQWQCPNLGGYVPTSVAMSQPQWLCPNLSGNVPTPVAMSQPQWQCPNPSGNVPTSVAMSQPQWQCPNLSGNVHTSIQLANRKLQPTCVTLATGGNGVTKTTTTPLLDYIKRKREERRLAIQVGNSRDHVPVGRTTLVEVLSIQWYRI